MKKILSVAMIFLVVLSTFSTFAPQAEASPDYQLTTDSHGEAQPSWSADGTKIVYLFYTGGWYRYLKVMNNDGTDQRQLTGPSVVDHWPAFSPDGTKIAFQRWGFRGDYFDLMIMDADGSNVQRITYSSIPEMKKGSFEYPRWTEDGTKLVFQYKEATTAGTGPHWICTMNIDGSDIEVLPQIGMFPRFCCGDTKIVFNTDPNYYPDGNCIALMNADGTDMRTMTNGPYDVLPHMSSTSNRIIFGHGWAGGGDLYVMNEDGSGLEALTSDGMFNGEGEWSPDEKYIVYVSSRSGNGDIWKMEAPLSLCPWQPTTPLPMPLHTTGDVVHDDKIYVVGGASSIMRVDTVYYATIKTDGHVDHNGWLSTTSMPDARGNPAVVVYEDWVYVLGGSANQPPHWIERDTVWFAPFNPDGTIGSWVETTRMPYRSPEVAVQWNGRIYILAGWDGYSQHNDVHYAEINPDGTLGSWIRTTSLPEVRAHGHQAVVHNGVIYFIGGTTGRTGPPHIHREVYYATIQPSGEVGAWTEATPLPVGLQAHAAVVYENDIFVMGGVSQSVFPEQVISDKVYKAHINPDGSLDSWVEWCRLPEPLVHHSSVVLNNRLYVIGGSRQDGSLVDTVYFADLEPAVPATVDIDPDTLNLKSKGKWITAYIELPEGYDVNDINVSTILLNDTVPAEMHPTEIGDHDDDGTLDLMVKFSRAETTSYILAHVNITKLIEERFMIITLTITGKLNDGTPFQGNDTIRITVPKPRGRLRLTPT